MFLSKHILTLNMLLPGLRNCLYIIIIIGYLNKYIDMPADKSQYTLCCPLLL